MEENAQSEKNARSVVTGREGGGKVPWAVGLMSLVVAGLWGFPAVWYTKTDPDKEYFWLSEQTNAPAWTFDAVPVGKSAERTLVADTLFNGSFTNDNGGLIRVFSAKRFDEEQNAIGLFVHTPDRCWTEAGWKLEAASPDLVEIAVHGMDLQFERRIFEANGARELVYFTGLTGGQPLPYRLDHNLSVGMKYQLKEEGGTALRASDERLWARVWDSFTSRRPLLGPKQFVRISTPIERGDAQAADDLLQTFLNEWLKPANYEAELERWRVSESEE